MDDTVGYEVNEAFSPDHQGPPENNNDKDLMENKMDFKTTAVSVSDYGVAVKVGENTKQVNNVRCNAFHLVLAVALVAVLISLATILALYVKETQDSDSSYEICLKEDCISNSAGKTNMFKH